MTNVADQPPPVFEPLEGEALEHRATGRRGPVRWAASLKLSYQARQAPTTEPTSAAEPAPVEHPAPPVAPAVLETPAVLEAPAVVEPTPPIGEEVGTVEDEPLVEAAPPPPPSPAPPTGPPDLSGALAVRARLRGETPARPQVEDLVEEEPAPVPDRSKPEIVKFPSARQLHRLDRKAERAAEKDEKRRAAAERAELAAAAEPAPAPPPEPELEPELVTVAASPAPAPTAAPASGLTRSGRAPRRRAARPTAEPVKAEAPELQNVPVWSATGDDEGAWARWDADPASTDADDRWASLDEDLHRELPKALRLVERWGGRRSREDRSMFDED